MRGVDTLRVGLADMLAVGYIGDGKTDVCLRGMECWTGRRRLRGGEREVIRQLGRREGWRVQEGGQPMTI